MEAVKMTEESLTKKIATSRSAEVFDLGKDILLKLFFKEYPEDYVLTEYINTKEAHDKGATAMAVYDFVQVGDRYGLTIQRIHGVTQIEYFGKHASYLFQAGGDMAKEHLKVHALHSDVLKDVRELCVGLLDKEQFQTLSQQEKEKAKAYLVSLPGDNCILHMDFHVNNILVTDDHQLVTIDWMTACKGSAKAEAAMMDFLLREAELFPGTSKLQAVGLNIGKKILYSGFKKAYWKKAGISKKDIHTWRLVALVFRLGTWNIASEKAHILKEIKKLIAEL